MHELTIKSLRIYLDRLTAGKLKSREVMYRSGAQLLYSAIGAAWSVRLEGTEISLARMAPARYRGLLTTGNRYFYQLADPDLAEKIIERMCNHTKSSTRNDQ